VLSADEVVVASDSNQEQRQHARQKSQMWIRETEPESMTGGHNERDQKHSRARSNAPGD
jgi:hypothetical protein